MRTERGFHRLVNFSDAVVAIAITLLILPLVSSADSGTTGSIFSHNDGDRLFAFTLSFAVIGTFWWTQHQTLEGVRSYNAVLVGAVFVWLFSIVFLPYPTELLAAKSATAAHVIYVGTMLVTAIASLIQRWALIRWPELQDERQRGTLTLDPALVLMALMGVAFVVTVTIPSVGLWCLLLLGFSRPLAHLLAARRTRQSQSTAN